MITRLNTFPTLILLIALLLAGCAPSQATPIQGQPELPARIQPTQGAQEKTVVIGFTTSLTGSLSQEAKNQSNGILLWMNTVNQRGGITLKDGTIIKFEPKFYDDQSDPEQVAGLYEKLVFEDNVNFFFSPYSSTLADAAAPIADKYQKIMIAPGAASDSIFKKGYQGIYQVYTPASKYLNDALDLLAERDPQAKRIAIVFENDRFSTSVVESLKKHAESKGFEIVVFESYSSDTTDFVPLIKKLIELAPDAILGGGHLLDGQALARQAYENSLRVKFMALLVAPSDASFANIGQAAAGIIGASQWEPSVQIQPDFGPGVLEFNQAYQTAYATEPSYHAAGGYAAGLILEKAILEADSLEYAKLKTALDNISMVTFFGPIRFERANNSHGLQLGHKMIYTQWQFITENNLSKQIIWPDEAKTAEMVYPIR